MSIRARGYRDERRRRVLREDPRIDGMLVIEPPRGGKRRRYSSDALFHSQPHVTEFLPETKVAIGMTLGLAAALDAATLALAAVAPRWETYFPEGALQFLQSFQAGSLFSVVQALQWFAAAGACLLILAVRRRRLDDFYGTHRVWSVSATLLGLFGVYALLPLSNLVTWGLSRIPRLPPTEHPEIYHQILLGGITGALLVRWLIEVRQCRLAQTCLVGAAILGGLSLVNVVPILKLSSYQLGEIISAGFYLAALGMALAGLLVYGRHVRLDAQGLIVFSKRKTARKKRATRKRLTVDDLLDDEEDDED